VRNWLQKKRKRGQNLRSRQLKALAAQQRKKKKGAKKRKAESLIRKRQKRKT